MTHDHSRQRQTAAEHIREFGWHCLHIFADEEGQENFTYTIGFAESFGAPEIVIFGLARDKAHALLGECAALLKAGNMIEPDVENPNVLAGGYHVVFKPVKAEHFDEYLGTANRYYQGRPFGAMVMFLPDREHRFPWSGGYDGPSADEALSIV